MPRIHPSAPLFTALFLLTAACNDAGGDSDPEGATATTTGDSTTGGSTSVGATASTTGADETAGGSTTTTTTATESEGTTGGSGDASLCEGACGRLVDCELEEDVGACLSWCDGLRTDAAMADPRIFPGCAARVEEFIECIAQDDACLEDDLCSDLEVAIEAQCGCERHLSIDGDECSYGERCGAVSRQVLCTGGTCVCSVGGEVVGECQSQAMICVDPMGTNIDPQVSAAGECCGWVPFEPPR